MTSMTKSQGHIGCLVANVALGRDGKAFQREVERLTDHMGPEWVCNRMKVLWNAANHLRNGDRDSAQELYRENGIAYHVGDMTPRGPFRPAIRQYVAAQRPSVIKRKAAALRFYTSFKLPSLTKKQWAKAYDAITTPSSDYVERRAKEMARQHVSETSSRALRSKVQLAALGSDWKPNVDDRYADQLRATSYYYSSKALPRELKGKPYASMTLSFLDNSYVPPSLDRLTPTAEMRDELRRQDPNWDLKPVGKISALQEQGAKARVVCMPSAPLQLAFAPLHKELASLAERAFPGASCVRDQQKGVYGVLRHMQEGKPVFCTDLSSATDRFPRTYSIELLKQLGYGRYAEALDDVCQKSFVGPDGELISYGTGQPMGLYGSFPLFHLSNLMVAEAAERVGLRKKPTTLETFQNGRAFYVLGDDVVFSDEAVSNAYRGIMGQLGVPISEHKSFEGKLAEFAGFMVTESREGFIAFRPYKVPAGNSVSNPVSFLDSLGSKVSKRSPYWARQWDLFKETTGSRGLDLSPHISEDEDFGPNPYRGDSRTLVDLANSLVSCIPDLPDISNAMRVSRIPMFRERRVNDYYGFSPEKMMASERVRKDLPQSARPSQALRDDPLIREVRRLRENPQSSVPQRLLRRPSQATPQRKPVSRSPFEEYQEEIRRQQEERERYYEETRYPSNPNAAGGGDLNRPRNTETSVPIRDHGNTPNDPTSVNPGVVSDMSRENSSPGHRASSPAATPTRPSQDGVWVTQSPNLFGDRMNPVKGTPVHGRRQPTSPKKAKSNDLELDL